MAGNKLSYPISAVYYTFPSAGSSLIRKRVDHEVTVGSNLSPGPDERHAIPRLQGLRGRIFWSRFRDP